MIRHLSSDSEAACIICLLGRLGLAHACTGLVQHAQMGESLFSSVYPFTWVLPVWSLLGAIGWRGRVQWHVPVSFFRCHKPDAGAFRTCLAAFEPDPVQKPTTDLPARRKKLAYTLVRSAQSELSRQDDMPFPERVAQRRSAPVPSLRMRTVDELASGSHHLHG